MADESTTRLGPLGTATGGSIHNTDSNDPAAAARKEMFTGREENESGGAWNLKKRLEAGVDRM